jgi:heme exporter protein B
MKQLAAALGQEWLLQSRALAQLLAVLVFGATSLLLFSFAVGPNYELLRAIAPGFLWLALLLSSTLTLAESFQAEMEHRALEGQLLLPASPPALYYAKALANWAQLSLVGIALVPVDGGAHDAGTTRVASLFLVILLGSAGLSAPGTLYAAMTAQARARQTLLPLLLFPLVVPVLLASVKASSLVILGDPMDQARSWSLLLVAFNLIHWSLCGLLFGRVVED